MRHELEVQLIESVSAGKLSEKELINLYNNATARGSSVVADAVVRQMRIDFPRAAKRMFGAKESAADKKGDALGG